MNEQRWSKAQERFNKWTWKLALVTIASLVFSLFAPPFFLLVGIGVLGMIVNLLVYTATVPREFRERNRDELEDWRRKQEAWKQRDNNPISAVLVGIKDVTQKGVVDTAARAAVGGALFGVVGAAVGINTAETKVKRQDAVFSVEYESGRIGTETATVGSARFNQLFALTNK